MLDVARGEASVARMMWRIHRVPPVGLDTWLPLGASSSMVTSTDPPEAVLLAYGADDGPDPRVERIPVGLINRTFRIRIGGRPHILQELHPSFEGPVNLDIEAITDRLAEAGLLTPRLHRTPDGRPFVVHEGRVWRVLTHLEGVTIEAIAEAAQARSAGELVARFHRALASFGHTFHHVRPAAHDTGAHLSRLRESLTSELVANYRRGSEIRELGEAILERARELPDIPELPKRIVHGDLKISNVLFHGDRERAIALLDLDTLAHGTLFTELGDALRSWCNPRGEEALDADVDVDVFRAAVEGYVSVAAELVSEAEVSSLVPGFETIALELASRFCTDAVEQRYFRWDRGRYESATEHNLHRARSQLSLSVAVRRRQEELDAIVRRAHEDHGVR